LGAFPFRPSIAMARSALLNIMVQAVLKAGRGLTRDFGEVENLQVSLKGPGNFVSAADHRAEEVLIGELQKARPAWSILSEESGEILGDDRANRWIVDPLDGTTNFLHGIPLFAISVALERDGEIVAGVIYNPVLNEMTVAERGGGAFMNDRRLRVAARRDLAEAVVATGMPAVGRPERETFAAEHAAVVRRVAGVRRTGSAAQDLAWVAAGRFDGCWQRGLSPWDIAAGILVVREAGGTVSEVSGGRDMLASGAVLAGNQHVHALLLAALREAVPAA
jgi:myo-inositol-1(or 4)-monophosphatase